MVIWENVLILPRPHKLTTSTVDDFDDLQKRRLWRRLEKAEEGYCRLQLVKSNIKKRHDG